MKKVILVLRNGIVQESYVSSSEKKLYSKVIDIFKSFAKNRELEDYNFLDEANSYEFLCEEFTVEELCDNINSRLVNYGYDMLLVTPEQL